ncbi:hypothetical protein SLEP1_g30308 [Rubroshorea leprosula]|uniref:Uncharacterized protein n=1 Tax=Rubroshorea leprosula TaxID=152421 RepID=A0AAV5K7G2_9ROSI|nr:hypothetical protein SLEP1_g30308 [Rubroshorea leprosula]
MFCGLCYLSKYVFRSVTLPNALKPTGLGVIDRNLSLHRNSIEIRVMLMKFSV